MACDESASCSSSLPNNPIQGEVQRCTLSCAAKSDHCHHASSLALQSLPIVAQRHMAYDALTMHLRRRMPCNRISSACRLIAGGPSYLLNAFLRRHDCIAPFDWAE